MKQELLPELASRLLGCGAIVLVTAGYQGANTITPCAWQSPIAKNPPLVSIALAKKHFSSELIQKSKEFGINIPYIGLIDKILLCGKNSGRNMDKFKTSGLTPQKAHNIKQAVMIEECIGNIECELNNTYEAGGHYIFVGKAVYVQAEAEKFKEGLWDIQRADLVFHLGGNMFMKAGAALKGE